jgi:hypothetical protein
MYRSFLLHFLLSLALAFLRVRMFTVPVPRYRTGTRVWFPTVPPVPGTRGTVPVPVPYLMILSQKTP